MPSSYTATPTKRSYSAVFTSTDQEFGVPAGATNVRLKAGTSYVGYIITGPGRLKPSVAPAAGTAMTVEWTVASSESATVLPATTAGMRAVLLGHSYFDQEMDNGQPYNRPLGLARGTVNWANFLLGRPIRTLFNAGIGGERIRDFLSRFDTQVVPFAPQLVFLSDPINDLTGNVNAGYAADASQRFLPYVMAGYEELVMRCRSLGATVIILGCSAPNPANSNALGARVVRWNSWAARLAARLTGVRFSPVHLATTDPTATAGIALSGAYADTIHPGIANCYARGKILAKTLTPLVPEYGSRLLYTLGTAMGNHLRTVASFTSDGRGTATMVLDNGSNNGGEIQTGDLCTFRCDNNLALNGTYRVLTHQSGASAVLTLACDKPAGTVSTGTMRATQATQCLDNPLFTTTSGGSKSGAGSGAITGNVPGSMSIVNNDANIAITVVDPATTPYTDPTFGIPCGNWLTLDVTAPSLGATNFFDLTFWISRATITGSPVYGRVHAGDVLTTSAEVEIVGASGGSGTESGVHNVALQATIGYTPPGGSATSLLVTDLFRPSAYTEAWPVANFRGVLETPEFTVPTDGTLGDIDVNLRVHVNPGASFRIRVARVSAEKWAAEFLERGSFVNDLMASQ